MASRKFDHGKSYISLEKCRLFAFIKWCSKINDTYWKKKILHSVVRPFYVFKNVGMVCKETIHPERRKNF